MKSSFEVTALVILSVVSGTLSLPAAGQVPKPISRPVSKPVLAAAFEPNRGQAAKEFEFTARGLGYAVGLTSTHAQIDLSRGPSNRPETVSLTLIGAKQSSHGQPVDQLKSINSYLNGQTSITGIPTFAKVRYDGVWRGVDVVYYGTGQQLEYDFVVAPQANPDRIRIRFDGLQSVRKSPDGDLILKTGTSELVEAKPTAYQLNGSIRTPVAASYRIGKDGTVGIELGNYDRSQQLVIDPITRYLYSLTGIGVSQLDAVNATGVATSGGNSFVAGWAPPGCASGCINPSTKVASIVTEFDDSGNALHSTFVAPTDGNVYSTGIATDASGNLYLTGYTDSPTLLPGASTTGIQTQSGGGQDAFLIKFDTNLNGVFSTYLGGSGNDNGLAVAVVGSIAYVAGVSTSTNFPVAVPPAGNNGFIYAIDTSQNGPSAKVYALVVGGSGTDSANGVAVDASGNVYVGGATTSLSSTFLPTIGGTGYVTSKTTTNNDGFLIKLNSSGTLLWGTFFPGGSISAVAASGTQAAVVGQTTGAIATTASAYQAAGHVGNGFVSKLDTAQSGVNSLLYSTYLGGTGGENILGVAIGLDNNVYVAGVTSSSNFPSAGTPAPLQPAYVAGSLNEDGFLSVLNPALSQTASLVYSTFVGASGNTVVTGIALDGFNYNEPTVSATDYSSNGPQIGGILKFGTFGPTDAGFFREGFLWVLDTNGNQIEDGVDFVYAFGGIPGDIPITGDWNGNGHTKIGIYRPSNGLFILDTNGDGKLDAGDDVFNLHIGMSAGDVPVVGDWNGDGRSKVGYFRQGFLWILDTNGNHVFEQGVDQVFAYGGVTGDIPVVGDWTGNHISKIGVFRQGFLWVLDANGNGTYDGPSGGDLLFPYGGVSGDVPVVGDWTGTGVTQVGIFRQGFLWALDANGNHIIDGPNEDFIFGYGGIAGDIPITGKWQ